MTILPLRPAKPDAFILTSDLASHGANWILDNEIRQLSKEVLITRRMVLSKLEWFLSQKEMTNCGKMELRHFFAYMTRGHEEPGGRWGNPHLTKPVRPRTVKDYFTHIRTFFRWLIAEGFLEQSPMETIAVPISRADQIQPFSEAQVKALLAAARQSRNAWRDEAVLMFLLDSGVRASELCGLRQRDVDMRERHCTVLGKGNKRRLAYFGLNTAKAINSALRGREADPDAPLFCSTRGLAYPLTTYGLREIIERAGKIARVEAVRCSPHTFRHTMAVNFLRNGGQVFALKELLGHTERCRSSSPSLSASVSSINFQKSECVMGYSLVEHSTSFDSLMGALVHALCLPP